MKQILIFLLITFSSLVSAQSHIVRGKVSDDMGGLAGATVVEVDKTDRIIQGVITDADGNYMIELSSPNSTMKFSFIGYKTTAEEVGSRNSIDVFLGPDALGLEEVVVVAERTQTSFTGISHRDQTGSSTLIKMDDLQGAVVTTVGDALQGQVAGLDILGGGSPGSGSSIVIRGLGSLGSSKPLVVVDGIAQKVSTSGVDFGSADAEDIGQLVSIAPEDIRSIRVLKDAAETAVWGTQGANGVLEIETFRGVAGKTRFDLNYRKSYQIEPDPIPLLNGDEYVMLQQEMHHNAKGVFDLDDEIANDVDYFDFHNYNQNTDWLEEITRTGEIDDFGFKLSGGGDKTRYYTSINYQNNTGTVLNTANKRFSTRINLDYKISNKLSLNTAINYVNIHKDDNWDAKGIRGLAQRKAPNMAVFEHNSLGEMSDEYFSPEQSYQGDGVTFYNPAAVVNLSNNDVDENNFQTNFELRYRISPKLSLTETVSFQFKNNKRQQFLPYTAIGAKWLDSENNSALERNSSGTLITTRTRLSYNPISNDKHNLSTLLLWEANQNADEWIQTSTKNGSSVNILQPTSNTLVNSIHSNASLENSVGALGQIHYKYRDMHIFTLNARVDANSMFGQEYRWGLFPSISYAWRFSNAAFLQDLTFLNDSKIRVSYGRSGNAGRINAYDRHGLYSAPGGAASYIFIAAIQPSQIELENLRWETSDQLNIGFDLLMIDNRLSVTAEFYDKITNDVLRGDYKLPSSSGYSSLRYYNEGGIRNTGWELNARVVAVRKKEWNVSFNYNIYANQNSFISLPSNVISENAIIGNGKYPTKAVVGTPVGSFFGFQYLGVYPTTADAVAHNADESVKLDMNGEPIRMNYNGSYLFEGGDARYLDVNHDGIIDLDDVVYLGDSNPDFAGGFGTNIRYKEFSLSAQFLYRVGYQIVNMVASDTESMSNKNNQSISVLRRWRKPGDDFDGMLPRAYEGNIANNLGSDRYVEDGDFLKLNNIALSYRFSPELAKKLHLESFTVGIQVRKLLTYTNYTGQDPEIRLSMGDDPLWFGQDDGNVPPPSIYALNIAIGF